MPSPRLTILEIIEKTAVYFEKKGIPSPRLDSELLLAHLLKKSRLDLYLNFDKPLDPVEIDAFRELVRRRSTREPLQFIIGEWDFREITLKITPAVMPPRQETEILVEMCLAAAESFEFPSILDIGTGSGAIGLSLATALPQAFLVATDISMEALRLARENAKILGLENRFHTVKTDIAAGITAGKPCFHLVASNPPYISEPHWEQLMPEVRDFEPRIALYGGADGLDTTRRVIAAAGELLLPGGFLLLEIGFDQKAAISEILAASGIWEEIHVADDYQGNPRVARAKRKP